MPTIERRWDTAPGTEEQIFKILDEHGLGWGRQLRAGLEKLETVGNQFTGHHRVVRVIGTVEAVEAFARRMEAAAATPMKHAYLDAARYVDAMVPCPKCGIDITPGTHARDCLGHPRKVLR